MPTEPALCRYGSLRSYDSAMALHALQPALRKPWLCPGCNVRLVGSYAEVRGHVMVCEAVQGVDAQAVETLGYAQASTTPRPAAADAAKWRGQGSDGEATGAGAQANEVEDAVERLERYMTGPVTWCRRRAASAKVVAQVTAAETGTMLGKWNVIQGRYEAQKGMAAAGGSGGQVTPLGAAGAAEGERFYSAGALVMSAGGAGGDMEHNASRLEEQSGRDLETQVYSLGLPVPATVRPFKCTVCGMEAVLTPPQILQHKSQHW